jgi:hypothetical protein
MKSFTSQQGTVTHLRGKGSFKHVTSWGLGKPTNIIHYLAFFFFVPLHKQFRAVSDRKAYRRDSFTEPAGEATTLAFGRSSVRIAAGTPAILTIGLRDFSQSLQANAGIITRLGHDRFIPNPF